MRHYLLGDPQEGIGTVRRIPGAVILAYSRMQMLSISFTKSINARRERSGVLFQGQFQVVLVCEDRHLLYPTAYLHLNPVRAGLTARPQDWADSSYRDYVGARAGSLPSPDLAPVIVGGPADYADFVRGFSADAEQAISPLLLEE
jgi:hypothetical protein